MRLRLTAALGLGALLMTQAAFPQGRGASGGGRGLGGNGLPQDNLVSPEVHADHTVTFRLRAPQASVVTLTGDWLATPASPTGGVMPMTKDSTGVWSATTPPLEATVHLYFFTMDGVVMADPVNPRMKLRVRTSASLVEVPGDPIPAWQFRDVPHGSMDWNTQHSAVYNDTHEFMVYLPAGYHTGKAKYPVLYLVHGSGDTALGWGTAGAANLILDSLIAEKKAVPMIVVMPFNGSNAPAPAGGGGGNAAGGGGRGAAGGSGRGGRGGGGNSQFEDYMLKELIPFVDANYRVAPGKQNRAMAGLSAGGSATYNIGFKHPELFTDLGIFSAAGNDFATRYPDLVANPKATNAKFPVIFIACGMVDPVDQRAKAMEADLTKAGIKHIYKDREGGHVWPVWRWALSEFAPMLFRKG